MARKPTLGRSAQNSKKLSNASPKDVEQVPAENVEILREGLGFDITRKNPQSVQQFVQIMTASMSRSPYSSAEMLEDYVRRGFPELPDKVIRAIDSQREHRHSLEVKTTEGSEKRQNRAQIGAQLVGILSIIGALVAGYLGVSAKICIFVVIVGVGGPNVATVLSRVLDKFIK